MLKNKSKVAIVGMGYWAPVLLRNLIKLNITVDAISETNFSRIKYIKKNYKKIKIFKSYKQMITNTEATAIIIATPARTHFKIAMDCLKKINIFLLKNHFVLKIRNLIKLKFYQKKINWLYKLTTYTHLTHLLFI